MEIIINRKNYCLITFLLFFQFSSFCQIKRQKQLEEYKKEVGVQLSDFFVCNCIQHGLQKVSINLDSIDASRFLAEEKLWTIIPKKERIRLIEKTKIISFNISFYDYNQKYAIILKCLQEVKMLYFKNDIKKIVDKYVIEVPKY